MMHVHGDCSLFGTSVTAFFSFAALLGILCFTRKPSTETRKAFQVGAADRTVASGPAFRPQEQPCRFQRPASCCNTSTTVSGYPVSIKNLDGMSPVVVCFACLLCESGFARCYVGHWKRARSNTVFCTRSQACGSL